MKAFTIQEAKTNLSSLVQALQDGSETEIVIVRDGRPAARLLAIFPRPVGRRLGVAKGRFEVPESIDADSGKVVDLF